MGNDFGPWIDHDGGQPDLDPMDWVEVQFAAPCDIGQINPFEHGSYVWALAWHHDGANDDIVKYRVKK
jgi:hypothetical protein